jgi:hypothetical protein
MDVPLPIRLQSLRRFFAKILPVRAIPETSASDHKNDQGSEERTRLDLAHAPFANVHPLAP